VTDDPQSAECDPHRDPDSLIARSADSASDALQRRADACALQLERAHQLGRRLGIQVLIDDTGWLRSEIEVLFSKELDGTIRAITVRVGRDASDDAVLGSGGVLARCEQYNGALDRLRQLAERLATMVREDHVTLDPGSPIAYAHHQLSRLDELIAGRQRITMGHGTVRLDTLDREIELFRRCDAHLAPIVFATEVRARPSAYRQSKDPGHRG
jgi:hypothetical protein